MIITLTAEEQARSKNLDVSWMQKWLKHHGAPELEVDGVGGSLTRAAILRVFVNKNAPAITEAELNALAKRLGDIGLKRLKAVAKVESGPHGGWFSTGLPTILYERHLFWRLTALKNRVVSWFSNKNTGGYTVDENNNGINDNWEKLSLAACKDPLAAFQAVSIGKFQVLGQWYRQCGYSHPIEMMWAARNSELAHYEMLVSYIQNVANLQSAFLRISTNPNDCIDFARGYNGGNYAKYSYHKRIAEAML